MLNPLAFHSKPFINMISFELIDQISFYSSQNSFINNILSIFEVLPNISLVLFNKISNQNLHCCFILFRPNAIINNNRIIVFTLDLLLLRAIAVYRYSSIQYNTLTDRLKFWCPSLNLIIRKENTQQW